MQGRAPQYLFARFALDIFTKRHAVSRYVKPTGMSKFKCTAQGNVESSRLHKEEVGVQARRSVQGLRLTASSTTFTRTMALASMSPTIAYAAPT